MPKEAKAKEKKGNGISPGGCEADTKIKKRNII